jgi:hypothetical protein
LNRSLSLATPARPFDPASRIFDPPTPFERIQIDRILQNAGYPLAPPRARQPSCA